MADGQSYQFENYNPFMKNIKDKANNIVKTALFQVALANLEWSRGYSWYVTLDDVPAPFHATGVLGLPVTDVTFTIADGNDFTWNTGFDNVSVPNSKNLCTMNISVLDDEQATIFTFFERWYNNIYNSRLGVLPVTEAAKNISIYKLTAARNPVIRHAYTYDRNSEELSLQRVNSRDFLVYPKGPLQEQETYSSSDPRKYNIELVIVNQINPDMGNPSVHNGNNTIFGRQINSGVQSFLDKAADYI